MSQQPKGVILLSGGLDSATVLAIAKNAGYDCHTISFDYGQRHHSELEAAERVSSAFGVTSHRVIKVDMRNIGGSALTDPSIEVPTSGVDESLIPITYVPARNTVFLSYALALAEVLEANDIFIGVNAVDYSGYPDCRPEFIDAFEKMANLATRIGVEGRPIHIQTPLIDLSKAEIIRKGSELGVDYALTISCYQADDLGRACGVCDSCRLRKKGFEDAGIPDPTPYQPGL
ncbi:MULTISPECIES: 7-cyano-7-deazaguanine synthase QueC [Thiomicrorhabdus]|uniref:7-cyano-7-deazaguanine synthase n=1 Tax=Thiomicrorhabdus heinhorstiae TaxID=2748010 RepID=A0ABS0BYV5_9GAMM|nr:MULTISPECIES: 7-cyano-7-deazaguanine synthase QueC [Thiomicrorhabdus]MBF6058026.1 7-cyano-7-deazaguanine synthase QueC [Thiomicrorhabdus heinhorstiae]